MQHAVYLSSLFRFIVPAHPSSSLLYNMLHHALQQFSECSRVSTFHNHKGYTHLLACLPSASLYLCLARGELRDTKRRLPPRREREPDDAMQRPPDDLRRRAIPVTRVREHAVPPEQRDSRLGEGPERMRDEARRVEQDRRAGDVVEAQRHAQRALAGEELCAARA